MYDQEMQFADPDWKPTRPLNSQGQDQDTYVPQPINDDVRNAREQREQQTVPPQEAGYRGLPPYTPPPMPAMQSPYFSPGPQKIGPLPARQRARRGRGAWLWIILVIIFLSVMGRAFNPSPNRTPFPFDGPKSAFPETQGWTFDVSNSPTLIMNDDFGTITVQTGDVGQITVQAPRDIAGDVNVQPQNNGNTITVTVSGNDPGDQNADITITVPQNTALQLQNNGGDISVNDLSGQMSLTTQNNGSITMNNDTLSGSSSVTANGGSITFNGSLDPAGNYLFKTTGGGDINVTIPGSSSVNIHESHGTGSFNNNFPGLSIGKSPQASLTLNTDSGSITVNQQ